MPQRVLNLDQWEFIRFVHGSNERTQTDCKIHFLVKQNGQVRLMMIKLDPWKRIDKYTPFFEPESVFLFSGKVSLPTDVQDFMPRLFSDDKIKNIQLLQNDVDKCS